MRILKTITLPESNSISVFENVASLVGVIDLKNGVAVHAIQGKRDQYRPVAFCAGDPILLLQHYVQLGIRQFYVADLDGIALDQPNTDLIVKLGLACDKIDGGTELAVDLGWRGRDGSTVSSTIEQLSKRFNRPKWIAATETMTKTSAISELVEVVGAERTILSLDYRNGLLQGQGLHEDEWLIAASNARVSRFLVLDLSIVGSNTGPKTANACSRIIACVRSFPIDTDLQIYSGGGIRSNEDISTLRRSGCNRFLLATALYPKSDSVKKKS
jgi:phosphoribosylformimino-5-aminoimidazole carboxamide ribotide isomerase